MKDIPREHLISKPQLLKMAYPSFVRARAYFSCVGYIYPDEATWEWPQVRIQTLSGNDVVYTRPSGLRGQRTLGLRSLTEAQKNELVSFLNRLRGAENTFEILPQHLALYWTCRLADSSITLSQVGPAIWDVNMGIIILDYRDIGIPTPIPIIKPTPIW